MYLPNLFAERDPERLRAFLEAYPFGLLVGPGDPPELTHLPFVFVRERDALWGHMARANPLWRSFQGQAMTAVFQGPHGYVSPRFYVSTQQVPTWNYAVVHVRGVPRVLPDDEATEGVLRRLSAAFEPPGGWSPEQLTPDFYADLRRAIVAFELPLTSVIGKFKLSQNRAPEDQVGVVRAFEERGTPEDLVMARWMRAERG